MKNDIVNRILNAIVAFAGIIISIEGDINWNNPQFWAGAIITMVFAYRNSGDKLPGVKKQ